MNGGWRSGKCEDVFDGGGVAIRIRWLFEDPAFSAGAERLGNFPDGEVQVEGAEWDDFDARRDGACLTAMIDDGVVRFRSPSVILGSFVVTTLNFSPTLVLATGLDGRIFGLKEGCFVRERIGLLFALILPPTDIGTRWSTLVVSGGLLDGGRSFVSLLRLPGASEAPFALPTPSDNSQEAPRAPASSPILRAVIMTPFFAVLLFRLGEGIGLPPVTEMTNTTNFRSSLATK